MDFPKKHAILTKSTILLSSPVMSLIVLSDRLNQPQHQFEMILKDPPA